jgi:hypothetical protein
MHFTQALGQSKQMSVEFLIPARWLTVMWHNSRD